MLSIELRRIVNTEETMNKQIVIAALLAGTFVCMPASAEIGFYIGVDGGRGSTELGRENDDIFLTNGIVLDTSSDREDSTLGIHGGYTFAKHFAIELSYADLGETSFTMLQDIELGLPFPFPLLPPPSFSPLTPPIATVGPPFVGGVAAYRAILLRTQQKVTFDSEALTLALLARYEFGYGFSVFGRAGIAMHRIETDLQIWSNGLPSRVIGGGDESSAGAAVLGVGGAWSFQQNWALRLQAQRHFILEEEEVNLIERGDVTAFTAGIEYRF
jgi:opacity protein-like surface antigen